MRLWLERSSKILLHRNKKKHQHGLELRIDAFSISHLNFQLIIGKYFARFS